MNQDQAVSSASKAALRASNALNDLNSYLLQVADKDGRDEFGTLSDKVKDACVLVQEIDAELAIVLHASSDANRSRTESRNG